MLINSHMDGTYNLNPDHVLYVHDTGLDVSVVFINDKSILVRKDKQLEKLIAFLDQKVDPLS